MSVLKCLSRLEMRTHVKECVVLESYAFIQECCFHFGNFSHKFNRGVMVVCLFNELFYFVSVDSPEREYIIYITFPNERFKSSSSFVPIDQYVFERSSASTLLCL